MWTNEYFDPMGINDPYALMPEPRMMQCPDCGGDKGEYWNEDGSELCTHTRYATLSEEDKKLFTFWPCEKCEGTGEIEDPYGPEDIEPEYYDD